MDGHCLYRPSQRGHDLFPAIWSGFVAPGFPRTGGKAAFFMRIILPAQVFFLLRRPVLPTHFVLRRQFSVPRPYAIDSIMALIPGLGLFCRSFPD